MRFLGPTSLSHYISAAPHFPILGATLSIVDTELSADEGDEGMEPTVEVCVRVDAVNGGLERDVQVVFNTMDGTATTGVCAWGEGGGGACVCV